MARTKVSPWGFIGVGAVASMLFLLVFGTVTIAPWWVSTLFFLGWLITLVLTMSWFASHPTWATWPPVIWFVLWLPVISLGTRQWGWV